MKKAAIIVLIVFVFAFLLVNLATAKNNDDLQAIKKAVKKNPEYEAGKEVKWFKVLVTDNRTKKDKVKITLPISLIEYFIKCAHDKHLKVNRDECEIDLKELFKELKKLGPTVFIEVVEDNETVKVWFE